MISDALLRLVRCPDCRGTLADGADSLTCTNCGRRCARGPGYLDLRPSATFTEQTKYLDESLHADARHETVSPALLQAGVRQWMLRRLLRPAPGDIDCGSGMRQRPVACVEPRKRRRNRGHRRRAVLRAGSARTRGSRAGRPAPPAVCGRRIRQELRARRVRTPVTRGTGRGAGRDRARGAPWRPRVRLLARPQELVARRRVESRQRDWRGNWNAQAWWTCGRSAFASRTTSIRWPTSPTSNGSSATPASTSRGYATTRRSSAPSSRTS